MQTEDLEPIQQAIKTLNDASEYLIEKYWDTDTHEDLVESLNNFDANTPNGQAVCFIDTLLETLKGEEEIAIHNSVHRLA